MALLVDPELREWGGRAILALARGWTARGRRVTVLDADFAAPSLPPGPQVSHREGLSDLLYFGASLDRVRVVLPGEQFSLVPAGTVVPDAAEAWSHPGWTTLLAGLRDRDQVVLVLLPGNREGTVPLHSQADRQFRVGRDASAGDLRHPLLHPASELSSGAGAPGSSSGAASGLASGAASGLASGAAFDREFAPTPTGLSRGDAGQGPDTPMPGGVPGLTQNNAESSVPDLPPVAGMTRSDQESLAEKPEARADRLAQARAVASADAPRAGAGVRGSAPVRRGGLPWVLILLVLLVVALVAAYWFGLIPGPGAETGQVPAGGSMALGVLESVPAFRG